MEFYKKDPAAAASIVARQAGVTADVAQADGDSRVRGALAGPLEFAATYEARAAVGALLRDPDWQVRETAAETTGRFGDRAAAAALLPLLDDAYWQVRLKAIRSPGILRSHEAAAPIGEALAGSASNLRKEAAAALGEIADRGSLAVLRQYEDDPDPDVRKTIRWAIGRLQ